MITPISRLRSHALLLLTACVASFFLVNRINESYWDTRLNWSEGRTALEIMHQFAWVEPCIQDLIKWYSLPLGAAFALALYGAMATFLELGTRKKSFILAGCFLFSFPLFSLAWFLIPCFFAPLAALGVFTYSVVKNDSKAVRLSALAMIQSILASIVMFKHVWDVDRLMGN